ncbi:MAG: hypothetical protein M3Q70_03195 [bacterium]|nr:hypothetical protein [bacterium]
MSDFEENSQGLRDAVDNLFDMRTDPCAANKELRDKWVKFFGSSFYVGAVRAEIMHRDRERAQQLSRVCLELPFRPKRSNNLVVVNGTFEGELCPSIILDLGKSEHLASGNKAISVRILEITLPEASRPI